jgi:hypothetical protein
MSWLSVFPKYIRLAKNVVTNALAYQTLNGWQPNRVDHLRVP